MSETQVDGRAVASGFDHHGPELSVDPWPTYKDLRERCPVGRSDAHGGFWALTDYETVWNVFRDEATFISGAGTGIPVIPTRLVPIGTDPPLTQKLRRMLHDELSPRTIRESEPEIYDLANELVDAFIEAGECDYVVDLALPLPGRTILRRLGFDDSRWPEFIGWIHKIVHEMPSDPEGCVQAGMALSAEVDALIESRRSGGLRGDITSKLLSCELDGAPLEDALIRDYILLLIFGGLDTSSAALSNALVRLDRQPELRQQLLLRPELVPSAIEEFLRVDSPTQMVSRSVSKDVVLRDEQLRCGDRVALFIAAANRDPDQFPDPDTVDFTRLENRHIAFGMGLHRCSGSNLGRAMFRIMLETVLSRTPDFELIGNPDDYRYADVGSVYALHHLPARFTPGPRVGARS
jgi:cytochrome P450